MRYPIAIHHDDGTAYGVTVPDVPGCFSAGDTLDEAILLAEEAIAGHLEILAEDNTPLPLATSVENHAGNTDYEGAAWAYATVDVLQFSGKTKKENITLPMNLTARVNDLVKEGKAKSKSAFFTEAGLKEMARIRT